MFPFSERCVFGPMVKTLKLCRNLARVKKETLVSDCRTKQKSKWSKLYPKTHSNTVDEEEETPSGFPRLTK